MIQYIRHELKIIDGKLDGIKGGNFPMIIEILPLFSKLNVNHLDLIHNNYKLQLRTDRLAIETQFRLV